MTDKSIKPIVLIILLFLLGSSLYSWSYDETNFEFPVRIALMGKIKSFNPYLELQGMFHLPEEEFRYASITTGTYYKAAPWLKVGAFYRFQSGARHLDDWQFTAGPPDRHWWSDTKGRTEHLIAFDATPRFLLDFLPGRNWVAPVKVRYIYNVSENLHNLILRPGLTFVLMPDREPLVNISLNYPLYFALNWGEVPLYSHGPYLSLIGHINQWLKVEGRFSYRFSKYFVDDGEPWTLNSSILSVGLGVIFTPEF